MSPRPNRIGLSTARLTLGLPEIADADAITKLADDPEVTRYTARMPFPYRRADACDFIAASRARASDGLSAPFFIRLKDGGALIGGIGLGFEADAAEFGYWLGRAYWNRGYATEAVAAVLDFAFDELNLSLVRGNVVPENGASARVMHKMSMTVVGHETSPAPARDEDREVDIYEITRDDWRDR